MTTEHLARLRELVAWIAREHPRTVVLDGLCMHGDYVNALNAALAMCETVEYARAHGRTIAWSAGKPSILSHDGETTRAADGL